MFSINIQRACIVHLLLIFSLTQVSSDEQLSLGKQFRNLATNSVPTSDYRLYLRVLVEFRRGNETRILKSGAAAIGTNTAVTAASGLFDENGNQVLS